MTSPTNDRAPPEIDHRAFSDLLHGTADPATWRGRARLWLLDQDTVRPLGNAWPDLKTMQTSVGGYVEHVGFRWKESEVHLFVNEDGHRLALPLNVGATSMLETRREFRMVEVEPGRKVRVGFPPCEVILGPALVWLGPVPDSERE